jgi:hypothetical protein
MSGQKACRDTNSAPHASGTKTDGYLSEPDPLRDGGKKTVKSKKWRSRVGACVRIIPRS